MAETIKYSVNAVGDPEEVYARTVCREISVMEDRAVVGWPTVDFKIRKPLKTSDASTLKAGERYTFLPTGHRGYFQPGDTAGYIETASGSSDFIQDET